MDYCRTFASSIRQKDNIIKVNLKIKERVTKMKKIVLTLVALMSMTTTFADNEGMNTTEAYNMTVNMGKLAKALGLTNDQVESVACQDGREGCHQGSGLHAHHPEQGSVS